MKKRTSASVTDTPCKCGYLNHHAANPNGPIKFDAERNEFYVSYSSTGMTGRMNLFHCPFCGGATPDPFPNPRFATIPKTELDRLADLTTAIESLEDAIGRFGAPDEDSMVGIAVQKWDAEKGPPIAENFRRLIYRRLSDVAEIHFTDMRVEKIRIHFQGKQLDKKGTA